MDDGCPLIGIIVLLVLLIFNGIVAAFRNVLYGETESVYGPTTELVLGFISLLAGTFCVRSFAIAFCVKTSTDRNSLWGYVAFVVSFIVVLILLAASNFAGRKIARVKEETCEKRLKPIHQFFRYLFMPICGVANGISNLLSRLFGVNPSAPVEDVTEKEIISMVNEGHEQGVFKSNEAEMIHNIFEFSDKDAGDIMTHRKNMINLSGEMTVSQALDFMLDGNNSRFPVYLEDLDNIIGIVHIKDVMLINRKENKRELPIKQVKGLVRTVEFIPETRKINALFKSMQLKKNHMVIVVDEYGQTSGLVTMEDILEELVGNIMDEYDEEEVSLKREESGAIVAEGMADLEEIQDELGISFDLDDYDTLNGFLISEIGDIPEENKKYEIIYEGYLFAVIKVENKLISKVRITKLPENNTDEERK